MKPDVEPIKKAAYELHRQSTEPLCAYLYDLGYLHRHVGRLMASLPKNCELFYAVKANSDAPILQALQDLVDGFEVASGGELAWVREHAPHSALIFGGPGKTDAELLAAVAQGVESLHVESLGELQRLALIAEGQQVTVSVLLRMNLSLAELPQTTLTMGGRPTPFGIDAGQLPQVLAWLQRQPHIKLRGFHFHLLSHQLDAHAHLRLLRGYFRQVKAWQQQFALDIDQINVGGGIGINYREPDNQYAWEDFCQGLAVLMQQEQMENYRIRFELGRYITAGCGYYLMEVLDIKQNLGQSFVIARGGTHHFRTPYAQGHSHPFEVLPTSRWTYPFARAEITQQKINVVGQLCTPKDILVKDTEVARLSVGDLLLFPYAGAYAWHISHHDFLRHPHPRQIYLPVQQEWSHAANQ